MINIHKQKFLYGYLGILLILFSIAPTAFANVPITFLPPAQGTGKIDGYGQENERLEDIINKELALDDTVYMEAKVKTILDTSGRKSSLIVYMLYKDTYSIDTARIDLDDNLIPVLTDPDYVEIAEDFPNSGGTWATCPDSSVQMVFSTMETGIPTAIQAVDRAAQIAQSKGFKVKILKGQQENTNAVKSWLSCSNLIQYGRVGHGNTYGIMLADGMLSHNYFKSLSQTALADKVLYFNSCQTHNDPLKSSIVNAGAQKFIGGITDLLIGPSEEVFKCWQAKVVSQNKAMTPSLQTCQNLHPDAGQHGISGNGSDHMKTGNQPPPPVSNELENAKPLKNINGAQDSWQYFKFKVPAKASNLEISISGGNGDADLYTRFGQKPTFNTYNCRPWEDGNNETCDPVATPQQGYYYIGLNGYNSFSGVTLIASYEKENTGNTGNELENGKAKSNLAASQDQWLYYKIKIPAGASDLRVSISGGNGDADLYTRYGSRPTDSKFDCHPYLDGNNESCEPIANPKTGYYYIGIKGWYNFSGVSLVAHYNSYSGCEEDDPDCSPDTDDEEFDFNTF